MFLPTSREKFAGPRQEEQLTARLLTLKENTVIQRIETEALIQFSELGLLAGRIQLTRSAAAEFGGRIGKHFGSSLLDIVDNIKQDVDREYVVRGLNMLAVAAFGRLRNWRWVVNKQSRIAVGLIGPRYRSMHNHDFWVGIRNSCLRKADKPRLFTAYLNNRNIDVVLCGSDQVTATEDTFVRGLLVQNAETSGRAVRAANVFVHRATGTWACDNFYADTRIPHLKGKKFEQRISEIHKRLDARRISDENLRRSWQHAKETAIFSSRLSLEDNVERLAAMLRGKGVRGQDARVVSQTVLARRNPMLADLLRAAHLQAAGRDDIGATKCRQVIYELCFGANNGKKKIK